MVLITITDKSGKQISIQEFPDDSSANTWIEDFKKTTGFDSSFSIVKNTVSRPLPPTADPTKGIGQDAARNRLRSASAIISADNTLPTQIKNIILDLITVSL